MYTVLNLPAKMGSILCSNNTVPVTNEGRIYRDNKTGGNNYYDCE